MTVTTEFTWPLRVYYEDTDAGGVVYHANYLRFMERARTEWLRSLGFEQDQLLAREGVLFAVRRVSVDFTSPARFNDRLLVSARLMQLKKASLTFQQQITRQPDGRFLCGGEVQIACVDGTGFRPCAIPKSILAGIPDVV